MPVGQKYCLRIGSSLPFSNQPEERGEDFFRRLCYFVDNVILYSILQNAHPAYLLFDLHSRPEAAEVLWLDVWQSVTPNTAVQTVAATASAGLGALRPFNCRTLKPNRWLRRPFSPCSVATSKPKRETRPSRCLS